METEARVTQEERKSRKIQKKKIENQKPKKISLVCSAFAVPRAQLRQPHDTENPSRPPKTTNLTHGSLQPQSLQTVAKSHFNGLYVEFDSAAQKALAPPSQRQLEKAVQPSRAPNAYKVASQHRERQNHNFEKNHHATAPQHPTNAQAKAIALRNASPSCLDSIGETSHGTAPRNLQLQDAG